MKPLYTAILLIFLTAARAGAAEQQVLSPPVLTGVEVLELETAQRVALRGNPDMAAALSRISQARARVEQAAAAWWPSLDLSGRYSRIRLSDHAYENISFFPSSSEISTDRVYDEEVAAIQASWLLFDGFLRSFRQEQARWNRKTLEAARRDAQRLLVNAVAEAFLNAQLAQTRVDIAEADRTFYQSQLHDAENRYEVGVGPWGDILNIKVQLNSAKTALLLNRREFEAAGYGLAALMGIPNAALPDGLRLDDLDSDAKVEPLAEKPEDLIEEALAIRPDIQQLAMRKKEAEAAVGQARAGYYPRVELFGKVSGSHQGDLRMSGDDLGDSVGVNVAWNLFAGGADRARQVEAKQREREIAYQLASLKNRVAAEVRQDIARLAAAEEQVRLQRDTLELVRENRDLARDEYEAGETSLVRLNEAQRDLTTTFGRLAQALVGYHQARHRLLAATGHNLHPFADMIGTDPEEDQ